MGQPNCKIIIIRNQNYYSDNEEDEKPKFKQQPVTRRQPTLAEINQQGVALVQKGEYDAALERFIEVSKLNPNYPKIQQNIRHCTILIKAQKIYLIGITLFNNEEYEEALRRFEYIEENLKSDFRDCRELMDECRKKIWMNNSQISALEGMKMLEQINKFYELMVHLAQLRKQQNNNDDDNKDDQDGKEDNKDNKDDEEDGKIKPIKIDEDKDKDEQPDFTQQIKSVYVYYECVKEPKCKNYIENKQFTHSECGKFALLNSDAMISCESNCQPYYIEDACFQCSGNTVCSKATVQMNEENYEVLQDLQYVAVFVKDCFVHVNAKEDLKLNFIFKLSKIASENYVKQQQ